MEGREPEEVTEYEYDENRLLVRSTTTREAEWTELDVAEVLALGEYRAGLCDCCGMPKSQVWAHERDAPNFVVSKRYCLARRTLIEAELALTDNGKNQQPKHRALRWSVRAVKR